ncbi:Insecticidal toxin complex protein [Mariniflexile gromovii]|uniref:Insecticidal toxin complex protein n=1 Tax=Mariniflexile gromovii TaxID=362523 RepID=A0ABS4BVK0_9FLAO|nr:Insecticidal toxin complex protein [Mariniflexile gromovii]MBP0904582.1 Insecticidal toxin complex protein [Mariniflexile gromovii]
MRIYCFLFLFVLNLSVYAKEWSSIRVYHKVTGKENLLPSDWLKSDRVNNTTVWQQANVFNLEYNLPNEYTGLAERKDFYNWVQAEVEKQGHQVVWFKMVDFITGKLHTMETFPNVVFVNKRIMNYAQSCSEIIFENSFSEIKKLFESAHILNEEAGLQWDKNMLYKEQYVWVDDIINTIDARSLKKIENILQGKCLYGLFVPRAIRFTGDLENKEMRYEYALNTLRPYFQNLKE